jgi:hypothetical protein
MLTPNNNDKIKRPFNHTACPTDKKIWRDYALDSECAANLVRTTTRHLSLSADGTLVSYLPRNSHSFAVGMPSSRYERRA